MGNTHVSPASKLKKFFGAALTTACAGSGNWILPHSSTLELETPVQLQILLTLLYQFRPDQTGTPPKRWCFKTN